MALGKILTQQENPGDVPKRESNPFFFGLLGRRIIIKVNELYLVLIHEAMKIAVKKIPSPLYSPSSLTAAANKLITFL